MNFDFENVRPFLQRLRDNRNISLDVEALVAYTIETEVEIEREMDAKAVIEGREIPFRFSVFMDDINAPDLYFFSEDKPLIDAIGAEFVIFCDDFGI